MFWPWTHRLRTPANVNGTVRCRPWPCCSPRSTVRSVQALHCLDRTAEAADDIASASTLPASGRSPGRGIGGRGGGHGSQRVDRASPENSPPAHPCQPGPRCARMVSGTPPSPGGNRRWSISPAAPRPPLVSLASSGHRFGPNSIRLRMVPQDGSPNRATEG